MLQLIPVKGNKAARQGAATANVVAELVIDFGMGALGGHTADIQVGRMPLPLLVAIPAGIAKVATAAFGVENRFAQGATHAGTQYGVGGFGGFMALRKAGA